MYSTKGDFPIKIRPDICDAVNLTVNVSLFSYPKKKSRGPFCKLIQRWMTMVLSIYDCLSMHFKIELETAGPATSTSRLFLIVMGTLV